MFAEAYVLVKRVSIMYVVGDSVLLDFTTDLPDFGMMLVQVDVLIGQDGMGNFGELETRYTLGM